MTRVPTNPMLGPPVTPRDDPSPRTAAFAAALFCFGAAAAHTQVSSQSSPSEDVEQITREASVTPEPPLVPLDRPFYQAIQRVKKDLNDNDGINFAVEDTLIYQRTSGGVDPNDAMVNTLGLFAIWKIFRDAGNDKNFAGLGFQGSMKKVGGQPAPHYMVMVGGGVADGYTSFGRLAAKVPARRAVDALEKLLQLYQEQKQQDEQADHDRERAERRDPEQPRERHLRPKHQPLERAEGGRGGRLDGAHRCTT